MENHSDGLVRNLFGEMVYAAPRKKGRPPFERTEENANKVSMLLAMGWKSERIASVILDPRTGKPISLPTLKRHFRAELGVRLAARDQLAARELMRAWAKAEEGNVGAMRLFRQLREDNDLMLAAARARQDDLDEKPVPAEPIGKKEAARRAAAEKVDGQSSFGDDLTPGKYTN